MPTALTTIRPAEYSDPTASMPVDSEARHSSRAVASESSFRRFPIEEARCATHPISMEWVPARERRVVPAEMTALCRRCPGREACLLWAMVGEEHGYWAGTTSADRAQMRELDMAGLDAAEWVQDVVRRRVDLEALHEPGEGSYWWYRRRGCRCSECKAANSARRAQERAMTKARAGDDGIL